MWFFSVNRNKINLFFSGKPEEVGIIPRFCDDLVKMCHNDPELVRAGFRPVVYL